MKPSIIPAPQKIRYTIGSSVLNDKTEIRYSADESLVHEEYRLLIDNGAVNITYGDEAGKFYAEQTLNQIRETCGVVCKNLEIEDSPKFGHRGFSLDCSRHFFDINQIKKLIDTAVFFKMNIFHWHLTDDQGWRFPSDKHPLLNDIGAKRKKSAFGGVIEKDEYSGGYTKDEITEIVNYCKDRFIDIIPEIDMPGHTTSVLASYNNLGCTGEPVETQIKEGIFDTVLCIGNPDSMQFCKDILDEVCELFPYRYIHIGGDEVPKIKWKACPVCNAKFNELRLNSYDEYQGWFMKSISDYLRSKGRTAITWNESLKGGMLDKDDCIIQRWMDKGNLSIDFANKGGKIIETDFYHYYCDYPYGMTPVKKTYSFNPVNKDIKDSSNVIGIEAEMWTEYVRNENDLHRKLFPRMIAIAERAWCGNRNTDYNDFKNRFEALRKTTEKIGIKIIPVEDWSMSPSSRVKDIFKFFKGSIKSGVDSFIKSNS